MIHFLIGFAVGFLVFCCASAAVALRMFRRGIVATTVTDPRARQGLVDSGYLPPHRMTEPERKRTGDHDDLTN